MIKHLVVLTLISASALHEVQAYDWMLWLAQQGRIKPDRYLINDSLLNLAATILINNQMKQIDQAGEHLELCAEPSSSSAAAEEIFIHQHENSPKITRRSLRNCAGTKQLQILSSPRLKFEENAFADMIALEVLILEQAKYEHVTQTLTRNLRSLKNLTITSCGVKLIDQNAFGTLDNLEHLDLSRNKLSLVYRLFGNLGRLKSLDLYENRLEAFPWNELEHLGQLEWLALGKNDIVHYDVDKIAGDLPKLKVIFVDFPDRMPCSIVDELRDDFRTKAGHVTVYEGIGTGRIRRCPYHSRVLVPQRLQSNEIQYI